LIIIKTIAQADGFKPHTILVVEFTTTQKLENKAKNQSKALRKNFATIGGLFDVSEDAFYLPQPYPSWTLNKTSYLWEPPVERPKDDKVYNWNEETQKWVEITE